MFLKFKTESGWGSSGNKVIIKSFITSLTEDTDYIIYRVWSILQFFSQYKEIHWLPNSSSNQSCVPNEGIPLIWWSQSILLWFKRPSSDALSADSWWVIFLSLTWVLAYRVLGLHRLVAMDVRQTCTGWKKDLPWSPAQQAAYLCVVWMPSRNLTTSEWKHAVLRDQERKVKKWCAGKL